MCGTCAQPPHDTGDAYQQAMAALEIIEKALNTAGARFVDVVRSVVCITDAAHAAGVIRAHGKTFGDILPVSTMVVVAALLKPHLVVEIEAYAIISS